MATATSEEPDLFILNEALLSSNDKDDEDFTVPATGAPSDDDDDDEAAANDESDEDDSHETEVKRFDACFVVWLDHDDNDDDVDCADVLMTR